jgi:hypothetical protein
MGSGAMIYIPSSVKIGSGIQKVIGGRYTDTRATWRSPKPIFIFKHQENSLKIRNLSGYKTHDTEQ